MKKHLLILTLFALLFGLSNCQKYDSTEKAEEHVDEVAVPEGYEPGTFGFDLEFLQNHLETIHLKSRDGKAQLAVVPQYQGRVMTSTAAGMEGKSFGWLNYELIRSKDVLPQLNPYGGEDRFWLGPEGGQYSIFFKAGSEFVMEAWATPGILDTAYFPPTQQTEIP